MGARGKKGTQSRPLFLGPLRRCSFLADLLESRIRIFSNAYRIRTGGRVVEGARLESVYTSKAYRGFESPSVRQESSKSRLGAARWRFAPKTRMNIGSAGFLLSGGWPTATFSFVGAPEGGVASLADPSFAPRRERLPRARPAHPARGCRGPGCAEGWAAAAGPAAPAWGRRRPRRTAPCAGRARRPPARP